MRTAYEAFLIEFFLDFATVMTFLVIHGYIKSPTLLPPLRSHFFLVPTLDEYLRCSDLGCISDLLGAILQSTTSYW
jgi:hypothetical protein